MKQQILDGEDLQAREALRHRRTHPLQRGDRHRVCRGHGALRSGHLNRLL